MQVAAVLGSPRARSSSGFLAQRFLDVAGEMGANTAKFVLNDLKFIGCQGCYGCKRRSETCVIHDDLAPVLEAVANCDVFVMATPVYILDVTGQTKCFIDRTFAYLTPDFHNPQANPSRLAPGKKMLLILTQGNPDAQTYKEVSARYQSFYQWLGFSTNELIVPGLGLQEKLTESRPEVIKRIEELARQMCAA